MKTHQVTVSTFNRGPAPFVTLANKAGHRVEIVDRLDTVLACLVGPAEAHLLAMESGPGNEEPREPKSPGPAFIRALDAMLAECRADLLVREIRVSPEAWAEVERWFSDQAGHPAAPLSRVNYRGVTLVPGEHR